MQRSGNTNHEEPPIPTKLTRKKKKPVTPKTFFPAYDDSQDYKDSNNRYDVGNLFHDRKNVLT